MSVVGYRGKRTFDVVAVIAAAPLFASLTALVALVLRFREGAPLLYRSTRIGHQGLPFELLKFRTMRSGADRSPFPQADDITPTGRMMRRTSLDELPQLWNVLRGDMSLVGPRPTLPYQVERYDDAQRGRLAVRPGLTGLAQVTGRNHMLWADRIVLDLEYVRTASLRTDLRILLGSVRVVLSGAGTEGHPTDDPLARPPQAS